MNAHTTIVPGVLASAPVPPIALLRSLPPGPLAREFAHLERARFLAEMFAGFDLADIRVAVDLLIAEMDHHAGDPDFEPEEDRCAAQDDDLSDVRVSRMGLDSDAPLDDDCCEASGWSEWHTRGRRKLTSEGAEERGVCDTLGSPRHEDEEDDDPREADGDELDTNNAEDELQAGWSGNNGPGCGLADGLEPILGAPEQFAGRWASNMGNALADEEREQMANDVPTLPVFSLDHNIFTDRRTYLGKSNLLTSFRSNGEVSADTGRTHRLRGDAPFVPGLPV